MEMITIKLTDTSGKDFVLLNLYGWNGLPVVHSSKTRLDYFLTIS